MGHGQARMNADDNESYSFDDWVGFDIGDHDDFEQEIIATSEHTELMTFLANRRTHGKPMSIADVIEELGLDQF